MNINIKLFNKAKKENDIEIIEILSKLMPEARIYINGIRAKISQKKWYEKNRDKILQKSKKKYLISKNGNVKKRDKYWRKWEKSIFIKQCNDNFYKELNNRIENQRSGENSKTINKK